MRPLILAALLTVSAAPAPPQPSPPRCDPLAFFAGRTEGVGRMKTMFSRTRDVQVHGRGTIQDDGSLVLRQTVVRTGKPPQRREWHIRQVAPGRYAGILSDAAGPIAGEANGNRLRLHYKAKGGWAIEQRLTLAADGRSAANHLTASRLGVVVARLDETIRRIP